MPEVTWWIALGAGFLSFISPCVLPIYPSYLSYITGISVRQLKEKSQPWKLRKEIFIHTLFFTFGFSIIFYVLGFSFSWISQWFIDYQDIIRMLGAIFIFIMGLFLTGIIQPVFLMKERKIPLMSKQFGYFGSMFVGIGFAAGWTPCIGPILSSVLTLTMVNPSVGLGYITAYNIGFAVPFFMMSFLLGRIKWFLQYSAVFVKIGGAIMMVMGVLLYFNLMSWIINGFSALFGGFTGF